MSILKKIKAWKAARKIKKYDLEWKQLSIKQKHKLTIEQQYEPAFQWNSNERKGLHIKKSDFVDHGLAGLNREEGHVTVAKPLKDVEDDA